MAEEHEHWNTLSVTHEVVGNEYRMTVSNSKTGVMQFSMVMPPEDAIDTAKAMLRICNEAGHD